MSDASKSSVNISRNIKPSISNIKFGMDYTLKKSLGQHFLKDESICKKIVEALQLNSFSQLLEVGAGAGALTKYLIELPHINFKTVEVDDEKVPYLLAHYPSLQGKIIHQDFLQIQAPFENEFLLIGNFPYNISSQILFKVLDWKMQVPVVIGMFQKEVAVRVAAKPNSKDYGIISVLIQAFYDVEYLFDVPPTCFNPPPKVMSGVIQLTRKKEFANFKSEKQFFTLVKAAFNQRRKMLRNPLKPLFDAAILQEELFTKRAENLSVEDFANLTYKMN